MNNLIVIHTLGGREDWLRNSLACFKNYDLKYPIAIVVSDKKPISESFDKYLKSLPLDVYYCPEISFETGCISYVNNILKPDQFIYLHDSIEIKRYELFDMCFDSRCDKLSVHFLNRFKSYAGKFRKEALDKINIPISKNKIDACINEDSTAIGSFICQYMQIERCLWLLSELKESKIYMFEENIDKFEEKFDRKNMIIENEYLKKYKGTWRWTMIKDE